MEIIGIDCLVPNYQAVCDSCGRGPVVEHAIDGKRVKTPFSLRFCGACYFGDDTKAKPETWNN